MASTGISLDKQYSRRSTAGTVILFDKYSTSNKSIIFEVRNNPVILSSFGLETGESIVIYSVSRVGAQELEQPFRPEGKNVYLSEALTSTEIHTAGRYRAVLNGTVGSAVCSYSVQQANLGRDVGMPSGAQANRPNLLLKEATNGDESSIIEIADAPWVFFAFGLLSSDKIYVYQTFGTGASYREELYKPDGKQIVFSVEATSHTLDKSGRYKFKFSGNGIVTLVGNPTGVEIEGTASSGDFSGTTDDVPEGVINLYFTEKRARTISNAAIALPNSDVVPLKPGWAVARQGAGYVRADKSDANKSKVAGIVIGDTDIPVGESFLPQIEGVVQLQALQWEDALTTPGGLATTSQYYLGSSGILSTLPPSNTGEYIVPIGLALSSTDLHVRINTLVKL